MKRAALCVCVLLGSVSVASAQSANHGVFVDAGVLSNTAWHGNSVIFNDQETPNLNGTSIGGSAEIGTWLTPRFSIRLEVALLGDARASSSMTSSETAGLGQTITITAQNSTTLRERTVSVLLGYATDRRHGIQLSYLGGAVFGFERVQESTVQAVSPVLQGITLPQSSYTVRSYGSTAEVGMDADVAIGPHLSIVPQARLLADDVAIRAGVALRARW